VNSSNDESYRYKMEAPIIRCEGIGNGIRTTIDNLSNIAQALKRSDEELVKHFEFNLGSMSKSKGDSGYEFMGKHDYPTIMKVLRSFISCYVLCKNCGNPETEHQVCEKYIISHCKACGH